MGTVNVNLGEDFQLNLPLGQQLENAVTAVVFDFSAWQTTYGSGTLALSVQRPGDEMPYAVTLSVSGTNATWSITDLDTAYKGTGEIQLTYTVGTAKKKSVIYKFTVYESLGANGEYPSPGQTWQEEMEEEIAGVKSDLGDLDDLETEDKTSIVNAINEIAQSGGSGLVITDYNENDIYLWDDGTVVATGITLDKNTMTFSDVGSQSITATLIPSNAQETVTWASSDESVATVVGNGLSATVTAVGNGTATITATTGTTALTASCAVTASGLPEEGVRYRFTGTDCTTELQQVIGGANVEFEKAPTLDANGVYLVDQNKLYIVNADNWFAGDYTIEIVFIPKLSEYATTHASGIYLFDGKYGTLSDGTASTQGYTIGCTNPRDNGLINIFGYNSSIDIRQYIDQECTIKIQHSTSSGAIYFNGNQISTTNNSLPSNKNVYFNGFNKSSSRFAHILKSFVIRDGVV